MRFRPVTSDALRIRKGSPFYTVILLCFGLMNCAFAQTASTGAVTGIVLDQSGSAVPGVTIRLVSGNRPSNSSCVSGADGWFRCSLVPPGIYELQASQIDFKPLNVPNVRVHVTETLRIDLQLQLGMVVQEMRVPSHPHMVQFDSSALGRTVNDQQIAGLPLVTRNFSQFAGLSPCVIPRGYKSGEL